MRPRSVRFPGSQGAELDALLDLPLDGDPHAYVLFAHCFTCGKDLKAVRNLSAALTDRGLGVLRFDFTGLGGSGGEFGETTFATNVGDLTAAAEYMERELEGPRVLVGHSLGGAAVLRAAGEIDSVAAVVTIGAPAEPSHVRRLLRDSEEEIREKGEADVEIAGRTFRIGAEFLDALEAERMEKVVGTLGRPLLLLHSPIDRIVGVENAGELFGWARHPKSFVSLDDADHLLGRERDSRWVGSLIAAWVRRYLPEREEESLEELERETQVLVETGEGFLTRVRTRDHTLLADEPVAVGGTNEGPSPYDLLVASLGTCTSMTVRMYADRKEWPLEEVRVRLRHHRVHAADCRDCPQEDARLERIERRLELTGPLDEEQRARLLEIANRCPVHRTLTSDLVIASELEDAGAS